MGAPDNHHEWVRKRLRRMDEKIDTIIYSLSMLDGKPFNVEKEKKRNYSVSAKQNSTPVGGWDAINKQASQMFGKIGAKCPKLERSKNRTSRGKLSAEGQNSEVSSEETSCVLTESVVSSEVVEKEPAIHRKQTPRSSKLSLPRLEKPKLPKIIPKSTLLLPEHILITGIEILYLLVIVGEALVVTTSFSMYKFHSDPPIQEVLWFTFATIVNLVFVLSRFCSAKLVGWQLIDDDARAIRNIYFRSWFVFDIGFGFPYDILAYLSSFILLYRVMQVVRCLKLFRAGSLFRPSNPLYNRRYVPFLSFCWVVIIHHGIACVHMLIRRKNSNIDDYIESIYWSVQSTTSVGYGDITDLNSREIRCYSVFVMLVGSGFYGWLLGNVSSYFMSQDIFMQKQNEMRSMLLSLMTRYDVSLEIQKEAMCIYPLILGDTANNFTEILELFPPYMQEKISLQVRLKLLRQVPMFRNAESFILEQLACKLTRHIIDPDVLIIEINDVGQEMFFISSGAVEVLVPVDGAYKQLVLLRDGSWFGEIAILRESRRTAAVNTVTTCDLFMLTKEDFLEIFEMFPDSTFRQAIVEEVEKRIKVLEPNEPEPEASPEMETPVVSIERGMSALVDSTVILDAMRYVFFDFFFFFFFFFSLLKK